ncbi:ketopantoate reductase family protein [Limibacillus halophilus]|uniref:2-dehydropantoate 2-reductase n=1 Tax=Limibacillus halophilus TaxID=1579333 RepID=A0A839SVN1_9PROT|nr:2-dehydropantoate 2-reductase [Limibacillus halophilus]MBB3066857.1 2-dehydropantoate 2-reductase [Limibacillus halophilus]
MRVLVVGAGGVGGYFGGRLAEAGHSVVFVARGRHADAMATAGLKIRSNAGDLHLKPVVLLDRLDEPGRFDLALICVKLKDTTEAAELVKPLLAPKGLCISLQNGVEAESMLADVLGREAVLAGIAYISAHIVAPGVIEHVGQRAKLTFGELEEGVSDRARAVLSLFQTAKFDSELSGEMELQLWLKFIMLTAFSGACCYRREAIGVLRSDPEGKALFQALMEEAVAVGRARGVKLTEEVVAQRLDNVEQLPPEMKPSMLVDLERGNALELPWLSGAVVRLGQQAGVPTPVSSKVVDALEPLAGGRLGAA